MKAVARAESQAVADERPEHRDHGHHGEALHHGAEHVFLAHQAAVEKRQSGPGHHQHQRRADQHPGVIGGTFVSWQAVAPAGQGAHSGHRRMEKMNSPARERC